MYVAKLQSYGLYSIQSLDQDEYIIRYPSGPLLTGTYILLVYMKHSYILVYITYSYVKSNNN